MTRRLSICYAAPGHALLSTAGTTRISPALAEALCNWADVTVAFRYVHEPVEARPYKVMAIEPYPDYSAAGSDDTAARGLNPLAHIAYLQALRSFSKRW